MNGMTIVLVLLAVAAVVIGIWGFMRWRYVESLRKRGWEFETSPSLQEVVGLNHAPFGAGFGREVDDMITGRAANGIPFKAIEYDYRGWGSQHYVVLFPLPKSLPFLYVRPADRPSRIPGLPSGLEFTVGGHTVLAPDEAYAKAVGQAILSRLGPLTAFEISVDHANLVVFDAPTKADDLEVIVHAGGEIAQAVAQASEPFSAPAAPPHLSFNHRPTWTYIARDDSYLRFVPYTRGGDDHEARDIVFGEANGISFVRVHHHWTTETRDSDGDTTTHHHDEELCQFHVNFPFAALNLTSNPLGIANDRSGLQFESIAFNEAYKITADNPKFAHDVLHPRMMQWLLTVGSPKFRIDRDGDVTLPGRRHWGLHEIDQGYALLNDFFARVPDFVWQNLGAWPRPIREHEWQ